MIREKSEVFIFSKRDLMSFYVHIQVTTFPTHTTGRFLTPGCCNGFAQNQRMNTQAYADGLKDVVESLRDGIH